MIKAIFWDNDGVLVDTEQLYFEATRRVLADIDIAFTPHQYMQLFLVESRGAWHLAAERGFNADQLEALRTQRNEEYGRLLAERPLVMDGIASMLESLHGRYAMGIVTSSRRDHFEIIHRSTGLLKYFDFTLTADDCTRTKPDPELYVKAVARAGVRADECIAIEDSARGLTAAVGAGVRCVVVPTPLTVASDFAAAYRILDSVNELHDVLTLS